MKRHLRKLITLLSLAGLLLGNGTVASARSLVKNICRVKGQEENTLHGLGLVVGLKGSGDGGEYLPTIRSLAAAFGTMGEQLGPKPFFELKETKNVALVMVTVTVPATGARQGDRLDCTISSIGNAKSLVGGQLFITPLVGPLAPARNGKAQDPRVYALAQGAVHIDSEKLPTVGKINKGCRLEEDFLNVFSKDGKITLVLDKNHADFQVAQDLAELINSQLSFQARDGNLAKALDPVNVQVTIPTQYLENPVEFVSQVLSLPILDPRTDARVVINEKAGSIVVGVDVEIGPVVVTHRNIVVDTTDPSAVSKFIPIDPNKTGTAKLKALVEALNAVKVPQSDQIEIIKGIERTGNLHGALIIE